MLSVCLDACMHRAGATGTQVWSCQVPSLLVVTPACRARARYSQGTGLQLAPVAAHGGPEDAGPVPDALAAPGLWEQLWVVDGRLEQSRSRSHGALVGLHMAAPLGEAWAALSQSCCTHVLSRAGTGGGWCSTSDAVACWGPVLSMACGHPPCAGHSERSGSAGPLCVPWTGAG